ncbi:MAG TPA: formyltransferase family protein [Tepidisphaeraceae bacterium]|nr:formyltransferase family protein [Tepidisphaeraceae bacterium]
MKIAVFTSNQPRHTALIESLATVADEVFAIRECTTILPGQVQDFFNKSPIMQDYFSRVIAAEQKVFGQPRFTPAHVHTLDMRMGDLSLLDPKLLESALACDLIIVFGASYIRGPLCDRLVHRRAINIHMGISPQYRGSSTNFWAMYDKRPHLVGATIHLLSSGLDSGPMLFHALPPVAEYEPFELGMVAVQSAHRALIEHIRQGTLGRISPTSQNRGNEIRYTRNTDFTDAVAQEYLSRLPSPASIKASLAGRRDNAYLRPLAA